MSVENRDLHTEAELRGTLATIANDNEIDLEAFRRRLAADSEVSRDSDSAFVIDINANAAGGGGSTSAGQPRNRIGGVRLLAVAACIAAVLVGAGLVAILRPHSSAPHPDPAASLPVPTLTLPGSSILRQYTGQGPTTLTLTRYPVPANYEIGTYFSCRGAGGLKTSTGLSMGCGTVAGVSSADFTAKLRITVRANTIWRLSVVRSPQIRTNGSVQHPVDPALTGSGGSGVLARGAGRGSGTVQVPRPRQPLDAGLGRIQLTCQGTGVTINSTDPHLRGKYTHTCFAGSEYVFEVSKVKLPVVLHIAASAETTWRLIVTN